MECPSCGNVNREGARFCDGCGAALAGAEEAPAPSAAGEESPAPGPAPAPPGSPEEIGGGRYRVAGYLGQGGRKRVYLCDDTSTGESVAVAVFSTSGMAETVLSRARREAQAMQKLGTHPHIVPVRDSGDDAGRPWIASAYMPGGALNAVLAASEGRRLPVEQALAIAADLCRGLEHAHSRGIVHRDLKPANVWLDEDGTARLGDFGLATTGPRSRAAMDGMLVGTVAYLPPEQALGRPTDARADLYSLGAVIYEALSGQPPFPGDDAVAIVGQHLNAVPVAPSRHNPEVPRALDELVLRLLAKAPDDRPPSAAEALAEIEELASRTPEELEAGSEPADENPLDMLAGGVFVGREPELEELRGAVDEALGGRGRLLLLVGEPGIGKTRTAEELATYARLRGAKVHWGRCHEGEGAPAYWPWAEAIRSYVREADPVGLAWEMGARRAEIATIVPELAEREGTQPEAPPTEAEQARFRLFDAVAGFLTGAGRSRPLVLVLDDLHWADEPSLLLLKFVARQLGDSGLLIVGTYRDVELGRHHPLARTLGDLAAVEQSSRVTLRGLDAAAIDRYIERTTGGPVPPGLAEAVHDQTEGNPFFVAEVVRLLASEGALERAAAGREVAIPQGVREVVGRRLDALSEEANRTLAVAAAIGRQFDVAVLERVLDASREDVERVLADGIAAQVIRESRRRVGRYVFSHALVRETLYAEIAGPRRVRLHGEIARALEEVHADDVEPHLAELAYHFLEAAPAGEAEKAVDYGERAARRATDQLAHEEAAAHYERVLDVVADGGPGDRHGELGLRLELGAALTRAGRFVAARRTLEEAATMARELGESEALVRAALGVSDLSEAGGTDEAIVALLGEALDLVGADDSGERSRLLRGLAGEYVWTDPQGRGLSLIEEAAEVARRAGDPSAEAMALGQRQFLLVARPEASEERLETIDELGAAAERAGDREMAVRAHSYRLSALLQLGDVAGADRELEAYAALAEALRQPRHLWRTPMKRAARAIMDGRFEEARALALEAARGGERAEEPLAAQFYAVQMALLHTYEGTVEEMLPEVRRMSERYPAIIAWRMSLVSFLVEAGRPDEARVEFERLAGNDFEDIPVDAQWLTGMARLGEAAAQLGDIDRSRILYDRLEPFSGQAVITGPGAASNGPVDRNLGMLALTLGRPDDSVRHLEAAVELAARMGDRPMLADSRMRLAAALLERGAGGDRERALELLTKTLDEGQRLGMRRLVERAIALRLEAHGVSAVDVHTSIESVIAEVESERPDLATHAAADGRVTIVFSDIENSTLMTERLGDERWIEILRAHNSIFRERLRRRGGYEVKNQGDGFMLAFPDPAEALACAAEIQRAFASSEASEEERIRVRMGLHTGEAIAEEGDFFGRTVILAARIAAQARGEEILVSEQLRNAIEATQPTTNPGAPGREAEDVPGMGSGTPGSGAGDVAGTGVFSEARELELKGLTGTHRVFAARWTADEEPVEAEPAAAR
jgi:class 3 adenylate cyclase